MHIRRVRILKSFESKPKFKNNNKSITNYERAAFLASVLTRREYATPSFYKAVVVLTLICISVTLPLAHERPTAPRGLLAVKENKELFLIQNKVTVIKTLE